MPQLDHCCLCSLLCPAVPVSDETSLERCTRRQAWQKNSRHAPHSIQDDSTLASFAREVVDLLDVDQSLLWVDAADVNTMRAAVTLAQQLGCTLHVGQGTGAEVVKRVTASEGSLSTTLA